MAFPVVATTNTTADTDGTSTVINMPASISAGDLLIVWDTNDATGTPRSQSGGSDWTRISTGANGTVISMAIFAKIAAGGDTLTLAGAAQDSATVSARITGHGVTNVSVDIMIGTPATGLDAAPNPPNVAHGGPQDYLVLESAHSDDDDDTATYWSSGYSAVNQVQSASSTSSCLTSVGQLAVSNTAENPGVMALAASEEWVAQTISIPPALPTTYTKFSDDFNRTDTTDLSADWDSGYTSQTNAQIVSNAVRTGTLGSSGVESVNSVTVTDDQWASAVIKTINTTNPAYVAVITRMTAPATYSGYRFVAVRGDTGDTKRGFLTSVSAGVGTDLATDTTTAWVATDEVRGISIGTRHTMQRKPSGGAWASTLTAVDGTHTSGRVGIRVYAAIAGAIGDAEMESYAAGDFTAPAATTPIAPTIKLDAVHRSFSW